MVKTLLGGLQPSQGFSPHEKTYAEMSVEIEVDMVVAASSIPITDLAVADGGTGSSDASAASLTLS